MPQTETLVTLTYAYIFKVWLFLLPLLAVAAWVDAASLRPGTAVSAPRLRLMQVPAVRRFFLLLVALTVLHYLSALFQAHRYLYGHESYVTGPRATPFFPFKGFHDLLFYLPSIQNLGHDAFWHPYSATLHRLLNTDEVHWMYPPSSVLLYAALVYGGMETLRWAVLCAVILAGITFALARWLVVRGARPVEAYGFSIGCLLLSYPFWIEVTTGNIEIFAFVLIAGGLFSYMRGRTVLAAVLLGIATGLKMFPFILFGVFLARRQYRQIVYGAISAFVVNVAGLLLMGPHPLRSLQLIGEGFAFHREKLMLVRQGLNAAVDHSIFGIVKQVVYVGSHYRQEHTPGQALTVYMLVAAIAGLLLYLLRIRHVPLLNQILALTILSILLPPTSYDYTLTHLYVPWALLTMVAVVAARSGRSIAGLMPVMTCFALLFASEMEIIFHEDSYNGQFKCLVLIVLLVLSLRYPWQDELTAAL